MQQRSAPCLLLVLLEVWIRDCWPDQRLYLGGVVKYEPFAFFQKLCDPCMIAHVLFSPF